MTESSIDPILASVDLSPETTGGLLTGLDPLLAFGSILLAIALTIAWTARFLTSRDGWLERRQLSEIENAREQRNHEQNLQKQKAENDSKIVDQVLAQTSGQTEQLIAQSNALQDKLFAVLNEQLNQVTSSLARIEALANTSSVTQEQTQQTIRTLQLELAQVRTGRTSQPTDSSDKPKFKPRPKKPKPKPSEPPASYPPYGGSRPARPTETQRMLPPAELKLPPELG